VLLKEKYPPSTIENFRYQNKDNQIEAKTIEPNQETYECYYCDKFPSASNEEEYLKNIVLTHNSKPAYPSITDLNKNNLKSHGKYLEI
jgi:hypothetical protein